MSRQHDSRSLRQLDLNLLLTFEVIYRERNLTRAAERLFVSQSAVSHGLARLREHLGDPLFVRRGAGVQPSPLAERLAPTVQEAMALLRRALDTQTFEAARDLRRVALTMHDEFEPLFLPPFATVLRQAAASVEIECVRMDRASLERDLGSGRLDLAIDVALPTAPELRHMALARDRFAVISRRRRKLDAAAYLAAQHVTVSTRRSGPSFEDLLLSRLGHERSVVARCQRVESACRMVAESDLLLTAPRLHAQALATRLQLFVLPLPLPLPPAELHVYWHRQADGDARSVWLRAQLLACTAQLLPKLARAEPPPAKERRPQP